MRRPLIGILAATLIATSPLISVLGLAQEPLAKKPSIIFWVGGQPNESYFYLDPIVIIEKGRLLHPASNIVKADSKERSAYLVQKYLRPGTPYQIVSYGETLGTATLSPRAAQELENPEELVRQDIMAQVKWEKTTATLSKYFYNQIEPSDTSTTGFNQLLATDVPPENHSKIGLETKLSANDKTALQNAAKSLFLKEHVPHSSLSKIDIGQEKKITIDSKNNTVLIGTYTVSDESHNNYGSNNYWFLSLIVEKQKIAYQIVKKNDNWSGRYIIGALDLDQDGTAELITQDSIDGNTSYTILKHLRNRWKPIYKDCGFSAEGCDY